MPTLRYRTRDELVARAAAVLEDKCVRESHVVSSYLDVEALLRLKLGGLDREAFAVVYLDNAHRVLAYEELFRGSVSTCQVIVREIARAALRHNASAVIVAHNHPSGRPEPSYNDEVLTGRILQALGLIDVRLLDHVIVTRAARVSFENIGLMLELKQDALNADAQARELRRVVRRRRESACQRARSRRLDPALQTSAQKRGAKSTTSDGVGRRLPGSEGARRKSK